MELLTQFIDIVLHLDKHLAILVQQYGLWIYGILFFIIFAETGFVIFPFLPGDSLLFVAGALAAIGEGGMKYNTMNNDEIILSLCARIRETRISLALTQQQLADRAQVGIATIKRIEKGGGLNLDTLISLLRALNKLHHLDAILFESEVRNFNEGYEGGESVGRLQVRQQAADLNRKASAPQSEEMSYSAAIENTLYW